MNRRRAGSLRKRGDGLAIDQDLELAVRGFEHRVTSARTVRMVDGSS